MVRQVTHLEVEQLNARILPSVNPILYAPQLLEAHAAPLTQTHILAGQGNGSYENDWVQSGAGIDYHLQGTARLAGMGQVTVTGTVHSVGFIQQGSPQGTLTFTNAHGSITVQLVGPVQGAFSPLPNYYHYHVIAGTGSYQHSTDSGTLRLQLMPTQSLPPPAGPAITWPAFHGRFSLYI